MLRYAIFFSIITIRNHYVMQTAGYDLGIENNLVWNAAHWNGPLFKTSVQMGGPVGTHIGLHQTYISYLIGILYRLAPRPETMLVLQSLLIGAAALPLFAYARRHLGAWTACLVAAALPLQRADARIEPVRLPLPAVRAAVPVDDAGAARGAPRSLGGGRDRADAGQPRGHVRAADRGRLFLLLTGERPRAGLIVAAIGAVYFVVVKFIVMPRFLGGATAYVHQYKDLVPQGEHGFGGVLKTVLGNPGYTATTILQKDKILYLLQIMAPLAFFPWRRPIGLLCSLPGFFFTMLATQYPWLTRLGFQYTAYWTSFLFLAVIANLRWLNRAEAAAPGPAAAAEVRASRRAWKVAMAAATLVTCYQLGPVFQQNTSWAGFLPLRVDITGSDRRNTPTCTR